MGYTILKGMIHSSYKEGKSILESYDRQILKCDDITNCEPQGIFYEPQLKLILNFNNGENIEQLIVTEIGSNVVLYGAAEYVISQLSEKDCKNKGSFIVGVIGLKIAQLKENIRKFSDEFSQLEQQVQYSSNNKNVYEILELRKKYLEYGEEIVALKQIFLCINNGRLTMQMQNAYVALGKIKEDFDIMLKLYELKNDIIIRDIDTFASMIGNNINKKGLIIAVISIFAVILQIILSYVILNPILIGGIIISLVIIANIVVFNSKGILKLMYLS